MNLYRLINAPSSISRLARRPFSYDVKTLLAEESTSNNTNVKEKINSVRPSPVSKLIPPSTANSENETVAKAASKTLPHWVQTPVDLFIFQAENVNQLMQVPVKYVLNGVQAVGFFAAMAKYDHAVLDDLRKQKRYQQTLSIAAKALKNEINNLAVGDALLALRSLLHLKYDGAEALIGLLREKLLQKFRLLGPTALINFLAFHSRYASGNELAENLQFAIEEWISRNLQEIVDPNDLLLLLTYAQASLRRDAEAKIVDCVATMNGEQLTRLLNILASKRSRSLPVLKNIAHRYAHLEEDFSIKKLAAVLSDICILNYCNEKMLFAVCRDIQSKLSGVTKPALICSIFRSLAIMRLRPVELLEAMCEWMRKNFHAFSPAESADILAALARCNFTPSSEANADFVSFIIDSLSLEKINDTRVWLDAVWSSAILGHLRSEAAASVLKNEFYRPLLKDYGDNDYKRLTAQMKLQNIDTAARLDILGYSGPYLDMGDFKPFDQINVAQYKEEPVKIMADALNNVAPRGKYMKTNVVCPQGYVIDALLRFDSEKKPVAIDLWETSTSTNSGPVAIILRHFYEKTRMSVSTSGLHAMAVRHMKALGYVLLEISANEMEQRRQPLARLQFLKESIDLALAASANKVKV